MEQAIPLVITAVVAYLLGVWRERERSDRELRDLVWRNEQAWKERVQALEEGREHPWSEPNSGQNDAGSS